MLRFSLSGLVLLLGFSMSAFAQEENSETNEQATPSSIFGDLPIRSYAGVSFGTIELDKDNINELNPEVDVLSGRIGARWDQYLDAEFRVARGLSNSTNTVDQERVTTDVDYLLGTYLKAGIGETFHPYLLLGYNQIALSGGGQSSSAIQAIESVDSDIALGYGIELKISNYGRQATLTLECGDYYDKDDTNISACQFGAVVWF